MAGSRNTEKSQLSAGRLFGAFPIDATQIRRSRAKHQWASRAGADGRPVIARMTAAGTARHRLRSPPWPIAGVPVLPSPDALELFGVRLVGATPENGRKLLLTLALVTVTLIMSWAGRKIARNKGE